MRTPVLLLLLLVPAYAAEVPPALEDRLGLGEKELCWKDRVRPVWLAEEKRELGEIRIPDGGDADERYRGRRDVARRMLDRALFRGPIWLIEGIAETFAEDDAPGMHPQTAAYRDWLESHADRLPVAATLDARDVAGWAREGGRPVSWAIVRLFRLTQPDYLRALVEQGRVFAAHLAECPDADLFRKELTELARAELENTGLTTARLSDALTDWIRAGFPVGSRLKHRAAWRLVRYVDVPEAYGCRITASWGGKKGMLHVVDRRFGGGTVKWRLPWPTKRKMFLGCRRKLTTAYTPYPVDWTDAEFLEGKTRDAPAEGDRRLLAKRVPFGENFGRVRFVLATFRRENGIVYAWMHQTR